MMGMYIFLASEVMFFGSMFAMYFYLFGSHPFSWPPPNTVPVNWWPSPFFKMTGFHGLHVAGGLIFLTLMLGRALKGNFNARHHVGFAAATLYWHFVDVVWIFLFGILYLAVTAV